jgi:hypothetical protein
VEITIPSGKAKRRMKMTRRPYAALHWFIIGLTLSIGAALVMINLSLLKLMERGMAPLTTVLK